MPVEAATFLSISKIANVKTDCNKTYYLLFKYRNW